MDVQTIDQQFQQLQAQARQAAQAVQTLGSKLQSAADSGDPRAREWSLDLRELALALKGEQEQIGGLLQSIHALLASAPQSQAGIGGLLGGLLNSNFGRAFENGAGFGLGTSLINKIL